MVTLLNRCPIRLANVGTFHVSQELISTRTEYLSSLDRATATVDAMSIVFIITLLIRIWFLWLSKNRMDSVGVVGIMHHVD